MRARAGNAATAIRPASFESEMPKPTVSLDLSELKSPRIHRLHGYWQHQRDKRGGKLPRRGDIAPDQIRDLLPNIMIVDVERDPMRFRYRLVGTRVVEYNGVEFTGRYLGEIGWPEEQDLIDSYTFVVDQSTAVLWIAGLGAGDRRGRTVRVRPPALERGWRTGDADSCHGGLRLPATRCDAERRRRDAIGNPINPNGRQRRRNHGPSDPPA